MSDWKIGKSIAWDLMRENIKNEKLHFGGPRNKSETLKMMRDHLAKGEIRFPTPEEIRRDFVIFNEASDLSGDWFKQAWLHACKVRERKVYDCLCRWVSECEPEQIVRASDGEFLGLGLYGGDGTIYVEARPPAPVWFGVDWGVLD